MITLREVQRIIDEELFLDVLPPKRDGSERLFPLLVGIVSGLLVGAVVALLFTPRTGREIRSRLAGRATEPVVQLFSRAAAARQHAQALIRRETRAGEVQRPETGQVPSPEKAGLPGRIKELREQIKTRIQEAIEAGREAAREKAAEERARYREMTNRPDALSDPDEPAEL